MTTTASTSYRHPRDRLVAYNEAVEREHTGDVVDTSNQRKVTMEIQTLQGNPMGSNLSGPNSAAVATSSSAIFTFLHEDHTLGNALRYTLCRHPNVVAAGYSIPHPLEQKMVLQVQTVASEQNPGYPTDVVVEGLQGLAAACDLWHQRVDEAWAEAIRLQASAASP